MTTPISWWRSYFNPRSCERSDPLRIFSIVPSSNFNPRSCERSDLQQGGSIGVPLGISIHAPARGATLPSRCICSCFSNFNPRSCERSDKISMENITKQIEKFQSTLLREERPISRPPEDKPVEFQSTLLREERPSGSWKRKRPKRFQSTLLREERRSKHMWIMMDYFISIHAPARGATVIARCQYVSYHISIHAPARGATNSLLSVVLVEIFQSTLLREERLRI